MKFLKDSSGLFVEYEPYVGPGWVDEKLSTTGEFSLLSRSLWFEEGDIVERPNPDDFVQSFKILVGSARGSYYLVPGRILSVKHDLFIGIECKVEPRWFSVQRISVFGHIFKVVDEDFFIGGDNPDAMPEDEFVALVSRFPWSGTEMRLYADSRIAFAVNAYFETREDFSEHYQDYMGRRFERAAAYRVSSGRAPAFSFGPLFDETRAALYEDALSMLKCLVESNAEEKIFEKTLPSYLELLFPQYIAFVPCVGIKVVKGGKDKKRIPDYLLVDARGNVDVLEIKRPFDVEVLLRRKDYHSNPIPGTELSGAVMQCQSYIEHLLDGGCALEERLTGEFCTKKLIPEGMRLRFVRPRGMVIMGRDVEPERTEAFDLIRRHYADVVDVITYDDLIRRFERIVAAIRRG